MEKQADFFEEVETTMRALALKEKKMDFQIQLHDGSWQESNVLPENPSCYKKAILIEGSNEVLTLVPVMDQSSNYRWAVK